MFPFSKAFSVQAVLMGDLGDYERERDTERGGKGWEGGKERGRGRREERPLEFEYEILEFEGVIACTGYTSRSVRRKNYGCIADESSNSIGNPDGSL